MKKIIATLVLGCIAAVSYGQGYLVMGNSGSSLITTNGGSPATTGSIGRTASSYYFELLVGPVGASEAQLTNAGLTTVNWTVSAGRLASATLAVPGSNPGDTVAMQIYGWSANLGTTWAQAHANAGLGNYTGLAWWTDPLVARPMGQYVLGGLVPPNSYTVMRGTGADPAGNVLLPGFALTLVPEPSVIVLGVMGLLGVYFIRRRK